MLRRSRMRVGLGPGVAGLQDHTGHGKVWTEVLSELGRDEHVKLVTRGGADVWVADGHDRPPDGRPLVVQVHEAGWRDPFLRSLLDPGFAAQIDAATAASVSAAAHVITPSSASRRQVIDAYGLAADRVYAVHHGVDHELFKPGLEGGRRRVGAPYVLFVGMLHPRKNFAAARQAVGDLASAGLPHVLAIVAGAAPDPRALEFERQALAELGDHRGRIVAFRGLSGQELARLMAGADAFCLPSWFEGFGLPALEAMACGASVVVSDRGALPEIVGDAGLVVAPDAAAVSGAVRRVLGDSELAGRLRRAAVTRAASFSWKRTAAGWLEVLRIAAEAPLPPGPTLARR